MAHIAPAVDRPTAKWARAVKKVDYDERQHARIDIAAFLRAVEIEKQMFPAVAEVVELFAQVGPARRALDPSRTIRK